MSNIKVQKLSKSMNNDYVQYTRTIDVSAWLEDVYIDDYYKESHMADEMSLVVIETSRDKVFCALTPVTDLPDIVTLTKDGKYLASASHGCHMIDLESGYVYTGDEDYVVGEREPFSSDSSWLSNCIVSIDFKVEMFSLSDETLKLVVAKYGDKFVEDSE